MNLFQALAEIGRGAAQSAVAYQFDHDPKLRRKAAQRADGCTPCAAASYVEGLRDTFSQAPPKKRRRKGR